MKTMKRKIKHMLEEAMVYADIFFGGLFASFIAILFAKFISEYIGDAAAYTIAVLMLCSIKYFFNKEQ